MPIPTSRLRLNQQEIAIVLPALEGMVSGIANAKAGKFFRRDIVHALGQPNVYSNRRADDEMASRVLAVRNQLKWINACRKVSLDVFEIAAAALALRVTRREKLAGGVSDDIFDALANKLEAHRKRAKRATIARTGTADYREMAKRWQDFVAWMRFNLLCFRPRRRQSVVALLHEEQRKRMRALADDVLNPAVLPADREQIQHLLDLATREVRRGRHDTRLRELLANPKKAQDFLVAFLLKHGHAEHLKPEFQPAILRQARLWEKFAPALVASETAIPDKAEVSGPAANAISSSSPELRARASAPLCGRGARPIAMPNIPPTATEIPGSLPAFQEKLANRIADWLCNEVEPGFWQDVVEEIRFQILQSRSRRKEPIPGRTLDKIITNSRPEHLAAKTSFELVNFYVEWALRWLFVADSDLLRLYSAVGEGLGIARAQWNQMSDLTRNRKLKEIYRRCFGESFCSPFICSLSPRPRHGLPL